MKSFLKKAVPYVVSAVVGMVVFTIIVCTKKIWNYDDGKQVLRILSDAFFVPGVILAGVGLLIFASNGGAFDMLSYAFIRFFDLFRRDVRNKKYKDFYEYREAKKDKKRGMAFMLIVGVIFIALAGIMLIAYYQK
ncbi:MAG: DUF3899 domain-containing protein [Clostridia bacterium]|nr:DUF3899 domain-containing protein [Clostridia bacterium]